MKLFSLLQCIFGFALVYAITLPGTLPPIVYRSIYSMQIFFFLSSRINQILINYKNKSTGALSPITIMLSWSGNLARLFTLLVDLGFEDPQIIYSSLTFFVFNFTPFVQYLIYRGNTPAADDKAEEKRTETEKKEKEKEKEKEEKSDEVVSLKKTKRREEQAKEEEASEQVVTRRKKAKRRED